MKYLYETTAVNEDGVDGQSYIYDGQSFKVTNPLSEEPGNNPEKFVGLALSTCLNSTVQAVLKEEHQDNASKTEVTVQLHPEQEEKGYYFTLQAMVSIDSLEEDRAKNVIDQAVSRCPMSKLLANSHRVSYKWVPYVKA